MGFRTVVILNNDAAWDKDPKLGQKIQQVMMRSDDQTFDGGRVVECVHTSQTSLLFIDYLGALEVSYGTVDSDEDKAALLERLKMAAEKLGYTLRKKPVRGVAHRPRSETRLLGSTPPGAEPVFSQTHRRRVVRVEEYPDPDSMRGDPGDR